MLFLHNSSEPSVAFGQAWVDTEAQEDATLTKCFVEVDERQLALFEAELLEYVDGRDDEEYHRNGQW